MGIVYRVKGSTLTKLNKMNNKIIYTQLIYVYYISSNNIPLYNRNHTPLLPTNFIL